MSRFNPSMDAYKARLAERRKRAAQLRAARANTACEWCLASVEEIRGEQARLKAERAEREARRAAA